MEDIPGPGFGTQREVEGGGNIGWEAYRTATGDRRVQMNVEVQPWVRETFKEIAAENDMTMADFFATLAAELG